MVEQPLRLAAIPPTHYGDYRYRVIFEAYKWDPQVEDANTVSDQVLLLDRATAAQLEAWVEVLAAETMQLEEALLQRPELWCELGLPKPVEKALARATGYRRAQHPRLMRFDFHPTAEGWALSEVNSDVPGGFAEASLWPRLAAPYFPAYEPRGSLGESLLAALGARIVRGGRVALVHCTSYADDRQIMQYLHDRLLDAGYRPLFAAPDHLAWRERRAVSLIQGQEGPLDGIVRFFPLEWLANLQRGADWQGFFDTLTPSCNHPQAILAQSKRLPLLWDHLGLELPTWRALLPQTESVKQHSKPEPGWVYKPALGRVGEGISIAEAVTTKEQRLIEKAARRRGREWIAQRKFVSRPLPTAQGVDYHLCIGAFAVDGRSAGFYGRVSPYPRIDAKAIDIPILVAKGRNHHG